MSPVGICEHSHAEIRKGAFSGFTFIRNVASSVKTVGCLNAVSVSHMKQQLSEMMGPMLSIKVYVISWG